MYVVSFVFSPVFIFIEYNSAPVELYMRVPQACKDAVMACNNSVHIHHMLCISRKPYCF